MNSIMDQKKTEFVVFLHHFCHYANSDDDFIELRWFS